MALLGLPVIHAGAALAQPVEWVDQFGTAHEYGDDAAAVAADGAGNVYVAGSTYGDLDSPNAGAIDAFVRKYTAAGALTWSHQFGTSASDVANGVAVDGWSNVYVVGRTDGSLSGPNAGGEYGDEADAFVRKYDASGALVWAQQFGTFDEDTGPEAATAVTVDAAGNVYVVGTTTGILHGSSYGYRDGFIRKYDTQGLLLWGRQFGVTGHGTYIESASADDFGNVFVVGTTYGPVEGSNTIDADAYVVKYDSAGMLVFAEQFGTAASDRAISVVTNGAGDAYVAGQTSGDLEGSNVGSDDAFVRKYTSTGQGAWTRQMGGAFADSATSVATDAAGDMYLFGYTSASLDGPALGDYDGFVRKYDNTGTRVWGTQIGGPSTDFVRAGAVSAPGVTYLAGMTSGSLEGTNAGGMDAFVMKVVQPPADTTPPTVSVVASPNPVGLNESVAVQATIDDTTSGGSVISSANLSIDGQPVPVVSDGAFDSATEQVTASLGPFTALGTHDICVTGADSEGNVSAPQCVLLAVYDPDAGSVSGAGWFDSPIGAYTPEDSTDADVTGRAHFAFVSAYNKGANAPTGNTNFRFKAAGVDFDSTAYQWLVVAGDRAQYKGTGTINGTGNYEFILTAIDGAVTAGGGADKLRMKISDVNTGALVYDNQAGASDTGRDATTIGAGNIRIDTK